MISHCIPTSSFPQPLGSPTKLVCQTTLSIVFEVQSRSPCADGKRYLIWSQVTSVQVPIFFSKIQKFQNLNISKLALQSLYEQKLECYLHLQSFSPKLTKPHLEIRFVKVNMTVVVILQFSPCISNPNKPKLYPLFTQLHPATI